MLMLRGLVAALPLLLAGCGPYVYPLSQTDTSIAICQNPYVSQQEVVNMAAKHCAMQNMRARLVMRGICRYNYVESDFECMPK